MMKYKNKDYYIFPLFTLWFVASPILSTQETADPDAGYVLGLLVPILLFGLSHLKLVFKPYHISAILMWLMCVCSSYLGPFSYDTNVMTIVKYLTFVIFFIVVSNYKFTGKDLTLFIKGYIILATAVAILIFLSYLGGYQHVGQDGFGGTNIYLGRYSIGVTGLYKNPNYLASFICLAVLFVLYFLKETKLSFIWRTLCVGVVVLYYLACFLTGARIALIVLTLILIGLYSTSFFNFLSFKKLVVPLLAAFGIYYIYSETIGQMMDLYLAGREMFGDDGREQAWALAFKYAGENFFFGCGADAWHNLTLGRAALNNLHNVLLEFFLNQGVVGFCLLAYTLFGGYTKSKRADRPLLMMIFLVTAIPLCFQNGVIAVNFWRLIIINRLALNYSILSEDGLAALFKKINYKNDKRNFKKSLIS